MNVNATGNACYYPITNAIAGYMKNRGESAEACLTPEVVQNLQNLEIRVRGDNPWGHFDTVEISGNLSFGYSMAHEECMETLGIFRMGLDKSRLTTTFTNEQVSERAVALCWLMEDRDPFDAINGWTSLEVSPEELAQHIGKIGSRIDECFAAGEITRQEYDDLNAGLEKYTEAMIVRCEQAPALAALRRAQTEVYYAAKKSGASQWVLAAFARKCDVTLENNIQSLVKKYFTIDRSLIARLVQQVRSGEDLIQKSGRQTNGMDNITEYIKSGYMQFLSEQDG